MNTEINIVDISFTKNLIRVKNRSGKVKKYRLILQEKSKSEKSKRIITYRIYVHVIDSLKEAAVEALDLD